MAKVRIVTDSNSGITQAEAKTLGVSVIPMPFLINGEDYLEDVNLTQEEFYRHLEGEATVSTSQPAVATVTDLWDSLLAEGEDVEIVHIPMSSGLSDFLGKFSGSHLPTFAMAESFVFFSPTLSTTLFRSASSQNIHLPYSSRERNLPEFMCPISM